MHSNRTKCLFLVLVMIFSVLCLNAQTTLFSEEYSAGLDDNRFETTISPREINGAVDNISISSSSGAEELLPGVPHSTLREDDSLATDRDDPNRAAIGEGIYSIIPDGGGDYDSLGQVIQQLYSVGVSGPVVFELAPGNYEGPFKFIGGITGSSETNTITFRSAEPDNQAVFSRESVSETDRAIILLSGAKHLVFDSLAFIVSVDNYYNWAIHLRNTSENIKITNNRFNQAWSSMIGWGVSIVASNSNSSISQAGNNVKNLLIEGNTFDKLGDKGPTNVISLYGSSAVYLTGLIIRNNSFNDIGFSAIDLDFVDSYEISNNTIGMHLNTSGASRGILVLNSRGGFSIIGNRIRNALRNDLTIISHSSNNERAVIANNVFSSGVKRRDNDNSNIRLSQAVHNIDIIYNSFHFNSTEWSYNACISIINASTSGLSVKNNSFYSTDGANIFDISSNPSQTFSAGIDYNNYYNTGNRLAYYGGNYVNTLTAMQTAFGNENSHQGNPNYADFQDLVPTGTQLMGSGTPISGFDKDINGWDRDNDYPSIGAYELLYESDLAATGIIGPDVVNIGLQTDFGIAVKNLGSESQNSYTVSLMKNSDPDPIVLSSVQATTPIARGETVVFNFPYTATEELEQSVIELFGKVELTGDSKPSNDQTEIKSIAIYPRELMLSLETFTQEGVPERWTAEAPWEKTESDGGFMQCLNPAIGTGNTSMLITPSMDSREAKALRVTFRDQWQTSGTDYLNQSYYLATSSDNGATWNIGYVFELNPLTGQWYDKEITFTTVDVGQPNIRVSWVYEAETDGEINLSWQIDDVEISKAFPIPPDAEDEEEIVAEGEDLAINLPNTGVIIQFSGTVTPQTINSKLFNLMPDVDLDWIKLFETGEESPVTYIAPRYWTIISTGGTVGNYSITLDLTGVPGIVNPAELRLLKRADGFSQWYDYGDPEAPAELPLLTWTGLDSFSDFAIGGFGVNTLPVELSSFTANITANMFVELQWVAETESNMLGYYVLRSIDNELKNADKVTNSVIVAHNTSSAVNYKFVDEDVVADFTYYYWLQSMDLDLTYSYHGPLSVFVEPLGDEGTIPNIDLVTRLVGAYPNPFNPSTNISFTLEKPTGVNLVIYNIVGQKMKTLTIDELFPKGTNSVLWDGRDEAGRPASSGIYFIRMIAGDYEMTKKIMMLK